MKGVRCLIPSSRPKSLPQLLSQTEQMFVKGWLKRVGQQKKRVGSGLPWDAEGYEAP
jgi:hypothetical protein